MKKQFTVGIFAPGRKERYVTFRYLWMAWLYVALVVPPDCPKTVSVTFKKVNDAS